MRSVSNVPNQNTHQKETQVLLSMGRQINRFRVPVAVVVAASMAMAVWAPASAAAPPGFRAPLVSRMAHGLPSSFAGRQALLSRMVQPHSIHRDTNPTTFILDSPFTSIKTSTGLTRNESIFAGKTVGSAPDVGLNVNRQGTTMCAGIHCQEEDTNWVFGNLPAGDFNVNTTTGNATIALGAAQSGQFGTLNFTFTHSTKTAATCNVSGSEFIYTGVLSGTQNFHTKITTAPLSPLEPSILGDVHGPSGAGGTVTFPNSPPLNTTYLMIDNDCQNKSEPPPPPGKSLCQTATYWSSPFVQNASFTVQSLQEGSTGTYYSYPTSSFNSVDASRWITFSGLPATGGYGGTGPAEASRYDSGLDNLPTISYSFTNASPFPQSETTTAPSTDTYFKGSATLRSTKSQENKVRACYVQTGTTTYVPHTQYGQYDTTGTVHYSWTNGSTRLELLADVGGVISVANRTADTTSSISHWTYT